MFSEHKQHGESLLKPVPDCFLSHSAVDLLARPKNANRERISSLFGNQAQILVTAFHRVELNVDDGVSIRYSPTNIQLNSDKSTGKTSAKRYDYQTKRIVTCCEHH